MPDQAGRSSMSTPGVLTDCPEGAPGKVGMPTNAVGSDDRGPAGDRVADRQSGPSLKPLVWDRVIAVAARCRRQ
jgi:hypothetical protein